MILIDFVPLIREMVMRPVTVKVLGKLKTDDCFSQREHLCLLLGTPH